MTDKEVAMLQTPGFQHFVVDYTCTALYKDAKFYIDILNQTCYWNNCFSFFLFLVTATLEYIHP